MKELIKKEALKRQNGQCYLSDVELLDDFSMIDTHRPKPKMNGGIYSPNNSTAVNPVAHMKEHGIYREREISLDELKVLIDAREQVRKLVNSLNNRILASKRKVDKMDSQTEMWIGERIKETESELGRIDRRIKKHLLSMPYDIISTALNIRGVGPITVAYMLVYVDITKARYASSLWAYCGLDKPSHERYTKGESGGGNKTLRTVLYTMADSFIKQRNVYRDVYDNEKEKLSNSERITKSRNTQGKLIECAWKDTKPSHRHGAAIRKMIKHFLADFWYSWRKLEGLETAALYVEEKMGHKGIVRAEERGWNV